MIEIPFGASGISTVERWTRWAPESCHLGRHHLVELELVAVLATVVLERPAAVLVVLGSARY